MFGSLCMVIVILITRRERYVIGNLLNVIYGNNNIKSFQERLSQHKVQIDLEKLISHPISSCISLSLLLSSSSSSSTSNNSQKRRKEGRTPDFLDPDQHVLYTWYDRWHSAIYMYAHSKPHTSFKFCKRQFTQKCAPVLSACLSFSINVLTIIRYSSKIQFWRLSWTAFVSSKHSSCLERTGKQETKQEKQ